MIHQEPIAGTTNTRAGLRVIRGGRAAGAGQPTVWSRMSAAWLRVWRRTPLDDAMDRELGRYFGRKPAEPGDIAVAEHLIRDLERHYGH